ncbi:hypothetical protein [Pararhizobium sp. O133]|uniref:hypothetical protein n=1 Tax=Pararhizobium sp. O133 TaxID=3449278 RepID=UPI003F68319B
MKSRFFYFRNIYSIQDVSVKPLKVSSPCGGHLFGHKAVALTPGRDGSAYTEDVSA